MDLEEVKYWVGFSFIPGIGRVRYSLLDDHFGGLSAAWNASNGELRASGLDERSVNSIMDMRPRISLDAEWEKLKQYNVNVVTCKDSGYPARLKEVDNHPPLLYIRGSLIDEDECSIAVVGTRRVSAYGRQVAEEITADLSRAKVTVVSGLARGVDYVAHQSAIMAKGRTIAVMPCGLDVVYPGEHVDLAQRVIEHGALVSEFPLGSRPKADHFPQRNRIMSGMSLGVLVIESGERSGALITAHLAAEQNREVFAVPGSIYSPTSKGPNKLIQEGAKLVCSCAEVLEELDLPVVSRQLEMDGLAPATDTEYQLLCCLSEEAAHINDVCHRSGLPIAVVSGMLTMLELRGLVKQVGGMTYTIS